MVRVPEDPDHGNFAVAPDLTWRHDHNGHEHPGLDQPKQSQCWLAILPKNRYNNVQHRLFVFVLAEPHLPERTTIPSKPAVYIYN